MKNLAIITARSGSKGLKDKNIRDFLGTPLIGRTIQMALESGCFDEVHLSTDSMLYAEIARLYGASVPFLRSAETSTSEASSRSVVLEVLDKYEERGMRFDNFMLLQPTSPLRTAEDIRAAYRLFHEKNASSVVAVTECDHSPLWCNTLPEDGNLGSFLRPEALNMPRQNLKTYYRINGAVYLCKVASFRTAGTMYTAEGFAYIMPKDRSIDIDDEADFIVAEALAKRASKA